MAAVTPEQLEVLSDLTEPDGLYEVVDGRIVEKPIPLRALFDKAGQPG
jgi:hypothetical protein